MALEILTSEDRIDLENKISEVSGQIADLQENGTGSGVTEEMSSTLWTIMQKTAFTEALTEEELTAFKTAWGITEEEEVTLSSISATYSGGSVLVGTSVDDLTGIVVTATYSDGTTATVTDYTLSGTIAEGSNTVTISYGGKSTTITVVGYVENEQPESGIVQTGSVLAITSGVTATQTGTVLEIA